LSASAAGHAAAEFAAQLVVGAALGVIGSQALLWFTRRVRLPTESLYPLRVIACVFLLFGVTTLVGGSGFLAVFVAGILVGDERVPFKAETVSFLGALSSLAEIVAFVAL